MSSPQLDLQAFDEDGYLVTPVLDEAECGAIRSDLDLLAGEQIEAVNHGSRLLDARPAVKERLFRLAGSPLLHVVPPAWRRPHELPSIADTVWHHRILAVLDELMAHWRPRAEWSAEGGLPPHLDLPHHGHGDRYVFHHVNAARHDAGAPGLPWHHDYEQYPQTNRSHLMVHVLLYPNGLDGTVGDLLLARGTHRSVASKRALWSMGWSTLPGTVVIDDLPPGWAVFMHSAMFHARRPRPGGEDAPRYFVDLSYCQQGIRWPGGYAGSHAALRRRYLAQRGDRPWLLDDDQLFDAASAHHRSDSLQGSLL